MNVILESLKPVLDVEIPLDLVNLVVIQVNCNLPNLKTESIMSYSVHNFDYFVQL